MDHRILYVVSTIHTNVGMALDTNELARSVNLSSSRLRHLFKREKGISMVHYQRDVRMEEARVLLVSTFLTIKEVMNRVGIGDNSHFACEFKKVWGMAPTMYRKMAKSSLNDRLPSP